MIVLGIETSCDETAAAVVKDGTKLLSSQVASSVDLHVQYGGVVPEIAARSHIESINAVISRALYEATAQVSTHQLAINVTRNPWDLIDAIAVTKGPGLLGSLLIGVMTARTLAIAKNKPLYGINHVEAHVYSNFLTTSDNAKKINPGASSRPPRPQFPILSLIVSGGHTQLVIFNNHFDYRLLGQSVDDAIGEAFDKAAKIIGLPYPGGPSIAQAAKKGNPLKYDLPKAKVEGPYNFSFSGLKTAVLRLAQEQAGGDYRMPSFEIPPLLNNQQRYDIAASFQRVAIETVVEKTVRAYRMIKPKTVLIAGGVAANQELRSQLSLALPVAITYAPANLCTDNGAMIASLGCFKAMAGQRPDDPYSLAVNPSLKM
ncbi:MAG TPA: tRNA (adenosine(37)-N6)-threonylcarbamoyltransferase complex transferase subunit TsaD [Candidatus Saccharibacteria bacterium]|nr:tRNA (adenosine(37)-N6)-threonylcarbamoyltransferase complex transferase subunit TsaD [Candidatus Saccharibacteria bacterium]